MSADGTTFSAIMVAIRVWNIVVVCILIKRCAINYLTYDAGNRPTTVTDLPWHIVGINREINYRMLTQDC
jgi:hypothetical protein